MSPIGASTVIAKRIERAVRLSVVGAAAAAERSAGMGLRSWIVARVRSIIRRLGS